MSGPGRHAARTEAHEPGIAEAAAASGPGRSLTVPGQARQVPVTRAFIARTLADRGLDDETACLLGSELVTNSVRHSNSRLPGGMITVTVTVTSAEVLVEVTDSGGAGVPVIRDGTDPCAEAGRGLLLVAALSSRWGYRRGHEQLTTWFRGPAEPDRRTWDAGLPSDRPPLLPYHSPEPAAGTFRTSDGQHADLFNPRHYPVRAVCQLCGEDIQAGSFFRAFEHIGE